jgi:hypothetical protein
VALRSTRAARPGFVSAPNRVAAVRRFPSGGRRCERGAFSPFETGRASPSAGGVGRYLQRPRETGPRVLCMMVSPPPAVAGTSGDGR